MSHLHLLHCWAEAEKQVLARIPSVGSTSYHSYHSAPCTHWNAVVADKWAAMGIETYSEERFLLLAKSANVERIYCAGLLCESLYVRRVGLRSSCSRNA